MHEQEVLLGLTRMEFFMLDDTRKALEPYDNLWSLAVQFKRCMDVWMRGPVFSLESEEVEKVRQISWRVFSVFLTDCIQVMVSSACKLASRFKNVALH